MACDCSYRANKDENIPQKTLGNFRSGVHLYPNSFNGSLSYSSIVHIYAKFIEVTSQFMRLVLLFQPRLHNTNAFQRR